MRVEYKNTFMDLMLYQAFHQFLSPVFQAFFLGFAALIFLNEYSSSGAVAALAVALTFYVLMWALQLVFTVAFLCATKRKTIFTKHVIELADDGLREETPSNRSVFFWHGIVKSIRRPGFIAVYVTSLAALVIPMRAFRSKQEAAQFLAAVRVRTIVA